MPVPDTARTVALQVAYHLGLPYREGFIKNRYIARTFIMPGQEGRKNAVRRKLNPIKSEFRGRNVLLVDDSIVRGTTSAQLVALALEAGARNVFFCSAAPAIRYPNVYGIDMPSQTELVAFDRDEDAIAQKLGCSWVMYQDLEDLEAAVKAINPSIKVSADGHRVRRDCQKGIVDTRLHRSTMRGPHLILRSLALASLWPRSGLPPLPP